jgi:uncharacterized OB-fold protein
MATVGVTHRDAASADFFEGTAHGDLLIRTCQECGTPAAPPVVYCRSCGSGNVSWTTATGRGTLISWSVVHPRSGVGPDVPRVIGIIELDEGPWVLGQVIGAVDDIATGRPVTVEFERPEGGEAVPVYRLGKGSA